MLEINEGVGPDFCETPPKASVWKEEFKGDICLEMKSVMSTTQKEKLKYGLKETTPAGFLFH